MTRYVVGFLHDGRRVALVAKNRPSWQVGKLNGIGGHIEGNEQSRYAMSREFSEEAGVEIPAKAWNYLLRLRCEDALIYFYSHKVPSSTLDLVSTKTDEEILIVPLHDLTNTPLIPNLQWIIPLAVYEHDEYLPIMVDERF